MFIWVANFLYRWVLEKSERPPVPPVETGVQVVESRTWASLSQEAAVPVVNLLRLPVSVKGPPHIN